MSRFSNSGDRSAVLDPAALEEAGWLWDAVRPADGDPQGVPVDVLTVLAYLHWARYQVLPEGQDQDDLRAAVFLFGGLAGRAPERVPKQGLSLISTAPRESPSDGARHAAAGGGAMSDYLQTGHPEELEAAVVAFQDAVAATPPGHLDLAKYVSALGAALHSRFELAGERADLDAAITTCQRAVDLTPPGHPSLTGRLSNLGGALTSRFELAGDAADLDAAITTCQRAVDLTRPGNPNFPAFVSTLGNALHSRFKLAGDAADLDAAITTCQRAVDLTPPGNPYIPVCLSALGNAMHSRFKLAGDVADLDAAITARQWALDLTSPGHPDFLKTLSNLTASLYSRFELAGDVADLDAAITAYQRAVDLTPPGHPSLPVILSDLQVPLIVRWGRAGDAVALDAAIDAARRSVDLTPPGHSDLPGRLSSLVACLLSRFELAGDAADLDAAIDAGRQAADLTAPGPSNLATRLSALGASLRSRFELAGDAGDLDAAIDACRRAVDLTPPGSPELAGSLDALGISLRVRFERTGDAEDLNAAIKAARQSVDLTSPGDPGLPGRLSNLGSCLGRRAGPTGDVVGLYAAIQNGRRAADLTPPGDPDLPTILSNLGASLAARFGWTRDAVDLDAAIDACRRAADLTPPGDPSLPTILSNLGICLLNRFELAGDAADLDAAVDVCRQGSDLTPTGDPDVTRHLANLGFSLFSRFELAGHVADLDAAIDHWRQASEIPTGAPWMRLAAARRWASAAADANRTGQAADGFAAAVGLLPIVAWHGLDRATREEQLSEWAGLAADAAACALLDARPELAVELLEQGRSVLWAQALNLRGDLTLLPREAHGLAERLDGIRAILDSPIPVRSPARPGPAFWPLPEGRSGQEQETAELRRRTAREWDEVLNQVRALDGFGHFLAAVPYAQLKADLETAVLGRPVVIVNASRYGCHALIVDTSAEQPHIIKLPNLTLDSAESQVNQMLQALAGIADPGRAFPDREKDRRTILGVLDWLWDVIAGPVLTALGHTSAPGPGSQWPRVWWCPTGPLAVLPIHAAGHHPRLGTTATSNDSTECVLDRVISSYTPTLTALTRARQPARAAPVRQLAVGMPDTPGLPPLPTVRAELDVLASLFPPDAGNHQLIGPLAIRADVLTAIAAHSWVHLSCHASQQQDDPASSGLALWDGALTITDLAAQLIQHRDLAFLSACQTAAGSTRHLDEAIHLAAAMQFLGYQHVIATMWTIADSPAPRVARTFYTALRPDDQQDAATRTAEALHHAVRELRQAHPADPQLWAPYINLGS